VRHLLLATVLIPLLSTHSYAQAYMSVDDLVKQLKPSAGGPTRGVRPHDATLASQTSEVVRQAPHQAASHAPQLLQIRQRETFASTYGMSNPSGDPQGTANLTVQFETGSDRLTPGATATLDQLGQALSSPALASSHFQIIGHTDTVGRPDMNQVLSERRAASVVDYITTHFGVERNRLLAEGKGESEPLVPTRPGVPEQRNRRVQIVNVGDG